jgi:hypothetical protein
MKSSDEPEPEFLVGARAMARGGGLRKDEAARRARAQIFGRPAPRSPQDDTKGGSLQPSQGPPAKASRTHSTQG